MADQQDHEAPARKRVTTGRDAYVAGCDLHPHSASSVESGGGDRPGPRLDRGETGVQVGSDNVQVNDFYGDSATANVGDTPLTAASGTAGYRYRGHAFISYVRDDSNAVDMLQRTLEAVGIPVWRDTASLWPGEDWRARIRQAITNDALVFIACFSSRSVTREKSYQNEELALAIEQLRQRRPGVPWLIPVRFDDCVIPDYDIGGGRTLPSLQRVDMFGDSRDESASRLVEAVLRTFGKKLGVSGVSGSSNDISSRRQRWVSAPRSAMVGQAPAGLTHDLDDLYMRAIGQLGSKKAPVRLGALHALSRLGQNNPSLRETVIKVICAYLRMPYMPPDGESGTDRADRLNQREELQVRLTAQSILAEHLRDATYGRRNDTSAPETFWPEIDVIDLTGASLVRLDLSDCRVRAIECNNAIFNGESLFRGLICDLVFFQKAVFKGHTDFRGADFINSAWFSYSTFAADVWFHGDEFFPAARFGRHASFKHVTFARKVLFKKAVFEGSADFEGITCKEGTKAMNMRGCQVYRPEAVSPDVSKEPSVWPLGWEVVVGQNSIATLQDRTLPAVSELLRKLTAAADAQEFEFILQDILSLEARSDTADRIKARSEVSKSMWYDVICKKFGDKFSVDTLSMIFQVIVIPDLGDSAVAKEIADWAGHAQPAVIGGLLAAARTSGDATWQLMMSLLQPSLARRWAADSRIASP